MQRQTEDIRTLYCCYLKKEIENRDQQMAYRALKIRKLEKEILLLDKQLMWSCSYPSIILSESNIWLTVNKTPPMQHHYNVKWWKMMKMTLVACTSWGVMCVLFTAVVAALSLVIAVLLLGWVRWQTICQTFSHCCSKALYNCTHATAHRTPATVILRLCKYWNLHHHHSHFSISKMSLSGFKVQWGFTKGGLWNWFSGWRPCWFSAYLLVVFALCSYTLDLKWIKWLYSNLRTSHTYICIRWVMFYCCVFIF